MFVDVLAERRRIVRPSMRDIVRCSPFCGGVSFGAGRASKKQSAFDPATLNLSIWVRAAFAGSPWTGVASAGGSGSRDLTEATNPPAVGGALNSLDTADFDGTNDRLGNATAISTLGFADGGSGGSVVVLLNPDALTGSIGNDVVLCDSGGGYFGVGFDSGSMHIQLFDGSYKTAGQAISTGAWSLFQGKWLGTGGNLKARVNSGAWQTSASTAAGPDIDTGTLRVGADYVATNFFNGRIAEIMISPTVISDADMDNIKSYINTRYALSL